MKDIPKLHEITVSGAMISHEILNKGWKTCLAFILDDERLVKVSMLTRRPTLKEVKRIHKLLTTVEMYGKAALIFYKRTVGWQLNSEVIFNVIFQV